MNWEALAAISAGYERARCPPEGARRMNWEALAAISAGFCHLVNRREFRDSRNAYLRTIQAEIFFAQGYPQQFALKAAEF